MNLNDPTPIPAVHPLMAPTSPTIGNVAPAFNSAQAQIEHAAKDSFNPHFKSKYADLPAVIEAHRGIFAEHALHVLQRPLQAQGGVLLQTVIMHESGEWLADGGLFVPAIKNDPQAYGSALTYARRYGLAALIGIAQDDDDGATAAKPPKAKATPKVDLAPKADRDKLEADIQSLPAPYPKQIGDRLRQSGFVWTQLTVKQLAEARAWQEECKDLAEAEA